jgi:phosphopantothenoylcysteine decarboxylase/phosphopantothenate--cysteine ligase
MNLQHKRIVLGITGGIAAYKAPNLVRLLKAQGAQVRVVLTEAAKQFVTPMSLQAVSGYPIAEDLFDPAQEAAMGHIALARWADAVLIAPASAHCLAKLRQGLADDLLSTLVLATTAPIILAPAMNRVMWQQSITQDNVAALQARGLHVLPVAEGEQACGETGPGRMLEPEAIAAQLPSLFAPQKLAGKQVLITAGPTHEAIDPVRFISNPSSGKMGYALAQMAAQMGAKVTLISGPCALPVPQGVHHFAVNTALEMYDKVMTHISGQNIFIAAAAVGDYRCEQPATKKIKKSADTLQLDLVKNPDILQAVAKLEQRPLCIGFAAETDNIIANAKQKLTQKNLDMICVNDVSRTDIGFGVAENQLHLITADKILELKKSSKLECAKQILQVICDSEMLSRDLSCV